MTSSKSTVPEEHELSASTRLEFEDTDILGTSQDEHVSHLLTGKSLARDKRRRGSSPFYFISRRLRRLCRSQRAQQPRLSRSCGCSRRSFIRRFTFLAYSFLATVVVLVVVAGTFFPSYTHLPPHYEELRKRVSASTRSGRGNPTQQKVFIVATISDRTGQLAGGQWAQNILQLIHLLGPQNAFLSIYENDAGVEAKEALQGFQERVPCRHSMVYEDQFSFDNLAHVTLPDGSSRVKRIAYLAEVRNRALKPLDSEVVLYDKLLYLNDVFFDPVDILQLLFSTNIDKTGQADYRAACAVDFINAFKFYDTFATRDIGGYGVGIPFFPWFAYHGDKRSHQDVISQRDAVRVKSCWGGMVAFDMKYFQKQPSSALVPETAGSESPSNLTVPYRFRAETDLFWDASECCLIHADIQSPDPENTGIYMNPYVRVAYTEKALSWLWFTRRFERLYTPIHYLLDILCSLPFYNPRRDEQPWQQVEEKVWIPDGELPAGGTFQKVPRLASHSGFCGRRALSVMKEVNADVGKYYEMIPVPT